MLRPFLLFTALAAVLAVPRIASAASVSVAPADTTVDLGNAVEVRVMVGPATDLKACKLQFGYDPTVLQFLGAGAGEAFTGAGNAYALQVVPDAAPADTAHVDVAQLVGVAGTPGVLVDLHFKAIGFGDSPIACAGVDFRDSFNVQTLPACLPAVVHVVHPTPALPTSWGRLKDIYR